MINFNIILKNTVFLIFILIATPSHAAWNTWLDTSIQKYRQDGEDGTNGGQALTIKAAKNEFESFQVLIYANGESLTNVDVSVGDFTSGGNTVDDIYIYKQHYITTVNKSRNESVIGAWPDALLPKVDRYYGETRNTFPMTVSSGKIQGVWIDVGTTTTTVAGTYTANVTISANGKTDIVLPITLVVRDFTLPSTKTFKAIAGMQDGYLSYGHMGASYNSATMNALYPLYAKAALYHGMSLWNYGGGVGATYSWDNITATMSNFSVAAWDGYYQGVRDGTAITSGPYTGAKAAVSTVPGIGGAHNMGTNSVIEKDTRISDDNKETAAQQYYQFWYNHFGIEGWEPDEYMFIPVFDEPQSNVSVTWYREADDRANEVEVALDQANDARTINTSTYGAGGTFANIFTNAHNHSELSTFPGFFDPWIGHFAPDNWEKTNTNSSYIYPHSEYPAADNYWAYLSCMSNSCAGEGSAWYNGQVDLSVDVDGLYNRLWPAVYYKHSRNGFLYWSLNTDMVNGGGNPFSSVWYYGSNGDGHLMYPGFAGEFGASAGGTATPNIGGTHDIPIESIRLKHIRDGIEDMEYFALAEAATSRASVEAIVESMFNNSDIDLSYWNLKFDEGQYRLLLDQIGSMKSGQVIAPNLHPLLLE
jgi:hypothetical protein